MSNDQLKQILQDIPSDPTAKGRAGGPPLAELDDDDLDGISGGLVSSSECGGMTCSIFN